MGPRHRPLQRRQVSPPQQVREIFRLPDPNRKLDYGQKAGSEMMPRNLVGGGGAGG